MDTADGAVTIQKIRQYYNHPGFIEANIDRVRDAVGRLPNPSGTCAVAFTAHSIPIAMADAAPHQEQLREVAGVIADQMKIADWKLVFQSRSGPPGQPWLEPDILDHIRALKAEGCAQLVVAPIGFISDHLEVVYDLDCQAKDLCDEVGMTMECGIIFRSLPRYSDRTTKPGRQYSIRSPCRVENSETCFGRPTRQLDG